MTIAVRSARSEDAEEIATIFAHYVEHSDATFVETPPSEEEWRSRIEAATLPFLVALEGQRVLGFARLTQWRDKDAYRGTAEDAVYVAPAATGRGIGGALLGALIDRAGGSGIREIIAVIADTGDEASMRLHLAAGFNERGRLTRVGHKHGRWLDTTLLQLSLR